MVTTVKIIYHRRDPDGIEAKVFHILQLLCHSIEVTAAVVMKITAGGISVALPESVSEDLVDCPLLPSGSVACLNG
jgi:hypothetical protein